MLRGLVSSRQQKGSIWVWAAGNGGKVGDNCNYDGYANSPYTITVGAITDGGVNAEYSEPCAALLVAAPSSGGTRGITTTDIMGAPGYSSNDCTNNFGGTSSAAPLVAGVVALMLSSNPKLGWKDVQYILMDTAVVVDALDAAWTLNGAGRLVNHKYGYGRVSAGKAVEASAAYSSYLNSNPALLQRDAIVNTPLPQKKAVSSFIRVGDVFSVEHVQVC